VAAPVTYNDWSRALRERYFIPENNGVPVTFFVDDDAIAELGGKASHEEGVRDFAGRVHGQLIHADDENPFVLIEKRAADWEHSGWKGDPPSLPLLAACVLAATRMARTGEISTNNYYVPFWALIGLSRSPARMRGYSDSIPWLWQQLAKWLDRVQDGRLGKSTITPHPALKLIGYSLSQALFRRSDRDKLFRFFQWFGLKPGSSFDARELLAYYRLWIGKSNLSAGAKRMAEDRGFEPQLLSLLDDLAKSWDGGTIDDLGRREAQIHVALDFSEEPLGALWLLAERPRRSPAEVEVRDGEGNQLRLRSQRDGWFDQDLVPLKAGNLDGGVALTGEGLSLKLTPGPVYVLAEDDSVGFYTSQSKTERRREYFVLAKADLEDRLDTYLTRHAIAGWQAHRPSNLPPNWVARRRVAVAVPPTEEVPPELSILVPAPQLRPSLWGGLPLPSGRSVYMLGGEPELLIPPEIVDLVPEVTVDGQAIAVPQSGLDLELRSLGLSAGLHEIIAGPTSLRFSTIASIERVVAECCGSVTAQVGSPKSPRPTKPGLGIRVCGAVVSGEPSLVPPSLHPPAILPRGRQRYVLLGSHPGQVIEVAEPKPPSWLKRIPLYPVAFELQTEYAVVWLLMLTHRGKWEVRLKVENPPNPVPLESATQDGVQAWAQAFLLASVELPPAHQELWDSYYQVARQLEVGVSG
jgi:hypothetical protein